MYHLPCGLLQLLHVSVAQGAKLLPAVALLEPDLKDQNAIVSVMNHASVNRSGEKVIRRPEVRGPASPVPKTRRTVYPNRQRRAWLVAVAFLGACLWSSAGAQTFGFALSYEGGLEPEVQLRDLHLRALTAGDVGLGLRLAGGVSGPLEAGLEARFRTSFGPLGTLAVGARADADVTGAFDLGVSGSGALGATGLEARLGVFNRNPGAFAPSAAYALGSRPFLYLLSLSGGGLPGGVGAHLELGATRRLGRTLILEATPSLSYASATGLGVGLEGRLQRRRLVGNDNGALVFETRTGPGDARSFVAAGAEYALNRRGLPTLTGALLVGGGDAGPAPGLRATASGELGGFAYRAEAAAEPYRRDAPRYRGNVAFGTVLGRGALGLEFGAAPANDFGVPPLLLRSSYALRF